MYKILLPTGAYLEGQFNLTFELSNQVFSSTDASVLPGSFSFPLKVPLTDANKALLSNPHLVTNAKKWQTYEGVWVEFAGVKIFYGNLTITNADDLQAQVNIVANPLKKLKAVKLSSLDLGGERDHTGYLTWGLLMWDTCRVPEDHDFVFVPMYNENRNDYAFDSGDPDNLLRPFYNYYDVSSQAFETSGTGALVPFVKVEYLLQQIFAYEDTGFAFVNAWQNSTDTELRRLYLFNNWDMRTLNTAPAPDLPTVINLANHVPDITATDFLKKLMAQWGLGLFTNVFNRTIRLVPIQALLQRPPAHNWTRYAISRPALEAADSPPGIYNYNQPEELPRDVPQPDTIQVFNTLPDYNTALPLPDGYYYIETEQSIVYEETAWAFHPKEAWLQHRGVVLDSDLERLDTGMESLLHHNFSDRYNAPVVASRFYEIQDPNGDTMYERRVTDPPVAVFLYRGFNDVGFANPFPVAANHIWNPDETGGGRLDIMTDGTPEAEAARSLNWFGDFGLFETAHKTWAYMLLEGKHIRLQLALPIADLVAFSFEDKVRISNMDYFVKKLRVGKPLGRGKVLVEASLVSVI